MIGNHGGHLRKPVQPSRTGLSIQELKAMTALRMSQGTDVLINSFTAGSESSLNKSSQQTPATYAPNVNNNSRSRRQASRAAATMYADQGEFCQTSPQLQPPTMTRVSPSPPPASIQSARAEKQPAHSLTVQELKELTRMRLARAGGLHPGQGPGSNNTSISTDGDLDLELHHHHTAGVNRKNSGNSLLTATTLESRESDSRPQSRSGTISPVSDSFIDDSDVLFSYNGGLVPSSSHSQVVPIHSGIASRRQGNIVVPGYLPVHMGATSTRIVNFHPNQIPTKGVGAGTGLIPGSHSSLQTMHAQATAQMAYLMDNQRRDTTRSDVLRVDDNASIFESTTGAAQGGIGSAIGGLNGNLDQISSMDFARLQQRFEENRALDIQRRQQQQQQILQNQALLVTRQQQALLRQRTSPFTFPESSGVNQEQNVYNIKQNFDFDDNGSSSNNLYVGNQFERRETISNNDVDLEESSSSKILSTLNLPSVEQRENFNVQYNNQRQQQLQFQQQQQQFQQQLQQQQLVTGNSNNNNNISENNEFKFSTDLPYAPPPVIGILKKQQAMALSGLYLKENGTGNTINGNGNSMFNTETLPPPPIMTQLMVRGFTQDSMGCTSPGSMRHKSALTIACPGTVRERTLSDVNSLAFQMAEACLDSSSTPSTPKFSHRSLPSTLMMGGVGAPDYLAQALRRMNSIDSVSSVGSNCVSPMNSNGLSLSVPRAIGMGSTSFVQTQSDNIFINSNNDNNNDNNNNSNNVSSNANSTNLSSTGSNMDLTNATVSWALG